MKAAELRRLREACGLSQEELARQMSGWGWYREKIVRLENSDHFCLSGREMQGLLDVLGAKTL